MVWPMIDSSRGCYVGAHHWRSGVGIRQRRGRRRRPRGRGPGQSQKKACHYGDMAVNTLEYGCLERQHQKENPTKTTYLKGSQLVSLLFHNVLNCQTSIVINLSTWSKSPCRKQICISSVGRWCSRRICCLCDLKNSEKNRVAEFNHLWIVDDFSWFLDISLVSFFIDLLFKVPGAGTTSWFQPECLSQRLWAAWLKDIDTPISWQWFWIIFFWPVHQIRWAVLRGHKCHSFDKTAVIFGDLNFQPIICSKKSARASCFDGIRYQWSMSSQGISSPVESP